MKKNRIRVLIVIITLVLVSFYYLKDSFSVSIEDKNSIIRFIDSNKNGNIDTGEIIKIGNEDFYVVDSNDNYTKLLTVYNLDLNKNIQSSKSLGYVIKTYNNGTLSFKDINKYLNNYKDLLNNVLDVTLLSIEDLDKLRINANDYISDKYNHLYSTSYWINNVDEPYYINYDGYFGKYDGDISNNEQFGVRPLVVVNKENVILEEDKDNNGNVSLLDIVRINNEYFYVIDENLDELKLLAMYNLNLNTNLQDSNYLGYIVKEERNDTILFASNDKYGDYYSSYKNSIVEEYVNKYRTYLETTYNLDVINASLINDEILTNLGCYINDNTCINTKEFVYSSSYWIDYRSSEDEIWYVNSNGEINFEKYYIDDMFGIRPMITIETKQIMQVK